MDRIQYSPTNATIVSIDPGTVCLGVGLLDFDVQTFKLVSADAFTIDANKLQSNEHTGQLYGSRQQRIDALSDYIYFEVLQKIQPFGFACESPFFNPLRPNAYVALVETLSAIRQTYRYYTDRKPMYLIDPPTVKKAIGVKQIKGEKTKEAVLRAMLAHPELSAKTIKPIEEYDEHSLDALAVGYTLLNEYLHGTFNLKVNL